MRSMGLIAIALRAVTSHNSGELYYGAGATFRGLALDDVRYAAILAGLSADFSAIADGSR